MKHFIFFVLTIFTLVGKSQTNNPYTSRMYFAWGYNKEWYGSSTIKISQPSLGNDYELKDITGNDRIGWDKLFQHELTIPQYNYRFGFFLKKHPSVGWEFNFDHTKYQMTPGQYAHVVGTINNQHVDTNMFIEDDFYYWKLNNGANFFCINVMKRFYVAGTKNGKIKLFNLYKVGLGPTVPHVENTLRGKENDKGFQFGGFNFAVEASYRIEFGKYIFLDIAQKLDYAYYFGLKVYKGTASQSFATYEVIGTLGIMLPFKTEKENIIKE